MWAPQIKGYAWCSLIDCRKSTRLNRFKSTYEKKQPNKQTQTHIFSPCGLLFGKQLLLQPPHWNATFILCSWTIFLIFRSVYRWKTTMMTTSTTTDPSHTSTKKDKKTDNGLQNATQKSKDWPTWILIKKLIHKIW